MLGAPRRKAITRTENMLALGHLTVRMTKMCLRKLLDFKKLEKRSSLRSFKSKRPLLKAQNLTKKRR